MNGPALAGGFELVLACDLVVAADHAKFGLPEVKRGTLRCGRRARSGCPKRIPLALATELAITGDPIDASRAMQLGLVNRVVAGDRSIDDGARRSPAASRPTARSPCATR